MMAVIGHDGEKTSQPRRRLSVERSANVSHRGTDSRNELGMVVDRVSCTQAGAARGYDGRHDSRRHCRTSARRVLPTMRVT